MKKKEMFGATTFMLKFISIQVAVLYITLILGDTIKATTDVSSVFSRYIPVMLVTLISVFLSIKFLIKRCEKSEMKAARRNTFIAPVLVTIILVLYGFYSVQTNMKKIEDEVSTLKNMYSYMYQLGIEEYSEETLNEQINQIVKDAEGKANVSWIITGISYLISAEIIVFIMVKKTKVFVQEELTEQIILENNITASQWKNENTVQIVTGNSNSNDDINWNL